MCEIVYFYDKYGKEKPGRKVSQIKRGKKKGWYKVEAYNNGIKKIFIVKDIKVQNKPEGG